PTRLLHIKENASRLSLVATNPSQRCEYVALSHRWGTTKPASTMRGNLQSRMAGFAIETLPATFRDAVITAYRLGHEFIWIDSLCIVQDGQHEWQSECPRMSSIYQSAVLTIAAPAAEDSTAGFLHSRETLTDSKYSPCPIQYRTEGGKPQGTLTIWYPRCHPEPAPPERHLKRNPRDVLAEQPSSVLDNRGWVMQERILSRRTLYFGSFQMHFECHGALYYESLHEDNLNWQHRQVQEKDLGVTRRQFRERMLVIKASTTRFSSWWHSFLEAYSTCDLSVSTDRMPAISGIPASSDKYLAGIWERYLPEALLWMTTPNTAHLQCNSTRGREYVAPSWSWASSIGAVQFLVPRTNQSRTNWRLRILSCHTTLAGLDPYGLVKAGCL
ncbi:heterokaryon incompatibility protein-domain-containing protein, partial [Thelonectria olida]